MQGCYLKSLVQNCYSQAIHLLETDIGTMTDPHVYENSPHIDSQFVSDDEFGISPTSVRLQCVIDVASQQQLIGKLSPEECEGSGRRRLAVRFALASDNSIEADYIEPNISLTDDDRRSQWWTQQEVYEIYEKARSVVSYFREYRTDYMDDFSLLFSKCCKSPKSLRGSPQIVDPLCIRAARGLERHIHEVLPMYRTKFVSALLDIQSKMTPEMDPELRARILQVKSLQLSKPSRILARHLAEQDSKEVADLIREELESSDGVP